MKLVCTDLDRTLLPNGEQAESAHARPILWQLLKTYSVSLAYVSGRDLGRILEAIDEFQLLEPDAIVADVGTSIYQKVAEQWQLDSGWQTLISQDWNGYDAGQILQLLEPVSSLFRQDDDRQAPYKLSFYYEYGIDEEQLSRQLQSLLATRSIKASPVFSHDPLSGQGLLDVLPQSATKREAVAYLGAWQKLDMNDVLFAGDSGNDVTALAAEHPGVLVANADSKTRASVLEQSAATNIQSTAYLADGALQVTGYESLNGNYAAGIVEGLLHFRPSWRVCLQDDDWLRSALSSA